MVQPVLEEYRERLCKAGFGQGGHCERALDRQISSTSSTRQYEYSN